MDKEEKAKVVFSLAPACLGGLEHFPICFIGPSNIGQECGPNIRVSSMLFP